MKTDTVTLLLRRIEEGEEQARELLVHEVYSELHALACRSLVNERPNHTLQPTALVNEVYLRVFQSMPEVRVNDRQHLLRTAARAMRQLLIDHARSRKCIKRGGELKRSSLDHVVDYYEDRGIELIALDDALEQLAGIDFELAQVVELKFFGGRTNKEISKVMDISERSVDRAWSTGRAWLRQRLDAAPSSSPNS